MEINEIKQRLSILKVLAHYSGELLQQQQIEKSKTYQLDVFDQPADSRYNVLFLYNITYSYNGIIDSVFSIYSYLGVKPATWYLEGPDTTTYPPVPRPEKIGQHVITIDEFDRSDYFSAQVSDLGGVGDFYGPEMVIDQFEAPDVLYFSFFNHNQAPEYSYFNNVGLNEPINLTQNDIKTATGVTEVEIPEMDYSYMNIFGYDKDHPCFESSYFVYLSEVNNADKITMYYPTDVFKGFSINFF